MIDRAARDQLASILRSYMSDEITAFQLEESLDSFRCFPKDETVESIAADLWGCYDDLKDHKVIASKQTWDYFNRVLLLLSSDAELEEERIEFKWHSGQVAPGICLLLAIGVSARVGWNVNLVSVFVPFGLLSMAISWVNRRRTRKKPAPETYPFPSFNALSLLRRRTRLFSKTPYPKLLAHRRIRHPLISAIVWLPTIAGWLLLSPIVLFFQTLPEKRRDTRIYLSSSESPSAAL